ncbi:unnamed protein product [Blepharisma stoltei]|uniref:Uncharacterized protein n=1 Tax=Blepharisma stoltei TaxID=1481888 RepID=A0AAU9IC51_9CILI|nr:unnamed protein product [Blepharisma stoltei]
MRLFKKKLNIIIEGIGKCITMSTSDDIIYYENHIKSQIKDEIKPFIAYFTIWIHRFNTNSSWKSALSKNVESINHYRLYVKKYIIFLRDINAIDKKFENIKKMSTFYNSPFLYQISRFWAGMCSFYTYNIETQEDKFKELSTDRDFGVHSVLVLLPDNRLFIFGGPRKTSSGVARIIDLATFRIKRLGKLIPRQDPGALYYQNAIYIFGGFTKRNRHNLLVQKYDFSRKRWMVLMNLPKKSDFCVCAPFINGILISGFLHKCIYRYDINLGNYIKVYKENEIFEWDKVMFTARYRVYLFVINTGIYESEYWNEFNWNKIANGAMSQKRSNGQFSATYFRGSIYYHYADIECKYYYKFDLDMKVQERFLKSNYRKLKLIEDDS